MKFHKLLVQAVQKNLESIFYKGKQADKIIESSLKSNKSWGSHDRAFIAQTTYEIVRWIRLYDYCIRGKTYFDHMHMIDLNAIIGVHFMLKNIELPEWSEFNGLNKATILHNYNQAQSINKVKNSIPDWLEKLGMEQLGEKWVKEISALNKPAKTIIRVNTLKTDVRQVEEILEKEQIEFTLNSQYPDAIFLNKKPNIFKLPEFKLGYFEMQDANSQMVAEFVNPKPGEKIIDACAGAGGKTLHLAAKMHNKGKIIALDTVAWKLDELRKRASRAGADTIESLPIVGVETIDKFANIADKLVLDVPCSGLGVLKRNPDSKWKLSADFINEVVVTQKEILDNYARMVKVGGELCYITCSILPIENNLQIAGFIERNQNFEMVEEREINPSNSGFDGFYMAKLKRTE